VQGLLCRLQLSGRSLFFLQVARCGNLLSSSKITAGDPPITQIYEPPKVSGTWRAGYESLPNPEWLHVFKGLKADLVGIEELG